MKTQQKTNQSDANIDYPGNQGQQAGGERAQGGQQGGQQGDQQGGQQGGQGRFFGGGNDQPSGRAMGGESGRASGGEGGWASGGESGSAGGGDEGALEVEYLGDQKDLGGQVVGQAVTGDEDDQDDQNE